MRPLSLVALAATACSVGHAEPSPRALVVFASSSLTDVFTELEEAYEAAHPGVDVQLSFAGSQVLALQIAQGAPAQVFASADPRHLQSLAARGLAGSPVPLASNELVVAVPAANPAGLTRFEQLVTAERIVVGTPSSPIGAYTEQLLAEAERAYGGGFAEQVRDHVVSEESNVRLVRAKVQLGEADAAVVYRTDVGPGVRAVPVPAALATRAPYAVAPVDDSEGARSFVAFVTSDAGRQVLRAHGFAAPVPD